MRYRLPNLSIIAFLFLPFICFSQKSKSTDSTKAFVNNYKFDLSLDMYNLFKYGTPGIMLRYSPSKLGAIRFRLDGMAGNSDYSGTVTTGGTYGNYANVKQYEIEVALGYEFHHNHNRFQLFGGPEFSLHRQYSKVKYDPNFAGNQLFGPNVRHINFGGVIGLKYFVLKRLSISSESTLLFQWFMVKAVDQNGDVGSKLKSQTLTFNNLRALNISFHF